TCDYPLWNLTTGTCPECGTAFRPSDFEFVANSVRFCCPHCNQAYYGTGVQGHLVPGEFDCVSCRNHIRMDEMVLRPAEGVEEEQTQVDHMPWLERRERGRVRAWFSMVGLALVQPGKLMRATPPQGSLGQAWWFAILTTSLIALVSVVPLVAFMIVPLAFVRAGPGGQGPGPGMFLGAVAGSLGIMAAAGIVFIVIYIALWGAVSHGILAITGKTAEGIGRTYQGLCYSAGANILTAVPCVGAYVGWIWWIVSAVLMVKQGQNVHGGRATAAVLALPGVSIVGIVGFYVWLVVAGISSGQAQFGPASVSAIQQSETSFLTMQLLTYAAEHSDRGPGHALQLVPDNRIGTGNFIATGWLTTQARVGVGETTLEQFELLDSGLQAEIAEAAAEMLPENTVAHRLGDFVFTYHGIGFANADGELWIVVMLPDPDVNPSQLPSGMVSVGKADGTVTMIAVNQMAVQLQGQNAIRDASDLPPLPDPATVTHDAPAIADADRSDK
ncbi:MAG: YIP1 family protein, partial [Planctomycetota bacterium]|nr:YIP1 family protein [Planctomycetota bacterium]